jgi:hypothetical protein
MEIAFRALDPYVENEPNYQNATRTMIDGYLPRNVRLPNVGKPQLICAPRHAQSVVGGRRVEGTRLRRAAAWVRCMGI